MVTLGALYETSARHDGLDQANRLYRQAAALGDAQAMCNIGMNYLAAKAGETDHNKALEWLHRAAELDQPMACWALAKMYLSGRLVDADQQQGMSLLNRAAENGFVPAALSLADTYRHGKYGIAANQALAEHWAIQSRPRLQRLMIKMRLARLTWPDA